jgi:DNA-binding response OmpR family regulator
MTAEKTILLVDDDVEVVRALRAVLEQRGYRVLAAADGNAGLAAAECERPDLVVVDMVMPRRSGLAVLETLKGRRPAGPPVILITASEGGRHRAHAERLGADDYLCKPFALDKLLASVQRLCPLVGCDAALVPERG